MVVLQKTYDESHTADDFYQFGIAQSFVLFALLLEFLLVTLWSDVSSAGPQEFSGGWKMTESQSSGVHIWTSREILQIGAWENQTSGLVNSVSQINWLLVNCCLFIPFSLFLWKMNLTDQHKLNLSIVSSLPSWTQLNPSSFSNSRIDTS